MSLDIWCVAKVDVGNPEVTEVTVSEDFNYTHNVGKMWSTAGCYEALYKSEGKTVAEVLPALRLALADMQDNPSIYRAMNPENGWGSYETAVDWLGRVIAEFSKYPKATIRVSA